MTETTQKTPLKWYYFLIYFAMIVGPIISILSGIINATGFLYTVDQSYGGDAEAIYQAFPALQPLDIVYGLCTIVVGVYQFFVRSALAKKKSTAPAMLNKFFVASSAVSCVYTIVFMIVIGVAGALGETRLSSCLFNLAFYVVYAVVMLLLHKTYFEKRKHIFCN